MQVFHVDNELIRFIFRIIGTVGYLLLPIVMYRCCYYLKNKIAWKIFLFCWTLGIVKLFCFLIDVYIVPEWNNIFSTLFVNSIIYWLIFYLYVFGTKLKKRPKAIDLTGGADSLISSIDGVILELRGVMKSK